MGVQVRPEYALERDRKIIYRDPEVELESKSFEEKVSIYTSLITLVKKNKVSSNLHRAKSIAIKVGKLLAKDVEAKMAVARSEGRMASNIGWHLLLQFIKENELGTSSSSDSNDTHLKELPQLKAMANKWLKPFIPSPQVTGKGIEGVGAEGSKMHFANHFYVTKALDMEFPAWSKGESGTPVLSIGNTVDSGLRVKNEYFTKNIEGSADLQQYTVSRNPRLEEYVKEKISKLEGELGYMQSNRLPAGKTKEGRTGGQRNNTRLEIQKDGTTKYVTRTYHDGLWQRPMHDKFTDNEISAKEAELRKEKLALASVAANRSTETKVVYNNRTVSMVRQVWTGSVTRPYTLTDDQIRVSYQHKFPVEGMQIEGPKGAAILQSSATMPIYIEKTTLNNPYVLGVGVAQTINQYALQITNRNAKTNGWSESATSEELMWVNILLSANSEVPKSYRQLFEIDPIGVPILWAKNRVNSEDSDRLWHEILRLEKKKYRPDDRISELRMERKILNKNYFVREKSIESLREIDRKRSAFADVSHLLTPIEKKENTANNVGKRKTSQSEVPLVFWLTGFDSDVNLARINMNTDHGFNKYTKFTNAYHDEKEWAVKKVEVDGTTLYHPKYCSGGELEKGMLFFKEK
jgi:hypothetical protein